MIYWIAGSVILVVIIYFMISNKRRNHELDTWGASIPVSNMQREAMVKLWEASQIVKPPSQDPLQHLSSDDREYLLKICSADFRPAKFGNANVLRYATFSRLIDKGFNPEHAAIIVGMIFNSVGKKNLGFEK
ncbi:MAG: hypothetical protein KAR47_03465 [Planctomycetes bacterium]|nr:hypothetical protein [Planctomycetota bacterium]